MRDTETAIQLQEEEKNRRVFLNESEDHRDTEMAIQLQEEEKNRRVFLNESEDHRDTETALSLAEEERNRRMNETEVLVSEVKVEQAVRRGSAIKMANEEQLIRMAEEERRKADVAEEEERKRVEEENKKTQMPDRFIIIFFYFLIFIEVIYIYILAYSVNVEEFCVVKAPPVSLPSPVDTTPVEKKIEEVVKNVENNSKSIEDANR